MVDRVDQHRDAERVRQEDELLTPVVAHLAGGGEEPDRRHPFVHGRLDLANDRMEVRDDRGHDLLEARVAALRHALDDRRRGGVFVEVAHGFPPKAAGQSAIGCNRITNVGLQQQQLKLPDSRLPTADCPLVFSRAKRRRAARGWRHAQSGVGSSRDRRGQVGGAVEAGFRPCRCRGARSARRSPFTRSNSAAAASGAPRARAARPIASGAAEAL